MWLLAAAATTTLQPSQHLPHSDLPANLRVSPLPACSVFLLFNIALGAYILGTITLLVVKNDERTGRYRDLSSNLKTYR